MSEERKKPGFELLLVNFFSNLGRMILVNLVFAVPLLCFTALSFVLYKFVLHIPGVVLPLGFLLASPFYSGVVVLSRDYSQGIRPDGIFSAYLGAVKENWVNFLIGGVIFYFAFVGCYFSVTIYYAMSQLSWLFYFLLFVSVLICIFFLFLFYAYFLMSASFELKFKDVIKNSALMTFGEIKQNFFLTIGILAVLAVVLLPVIVILHLASVVPVETVKILLIVYIAFAFGVLIPAPCTMLIGHFLYPNMKSVIAGRDDSAENIKAPEPDIKPRNTAFDTDKRPSAEDFGDLLSGDDDEYVFYNGKMIRRKVLRQLVQGEGEGNDE